MPGPGPGARIRADQLVVDRGLARSRAEAQALILAGAIRVQGAEGRRLAAGQRLDPSLTLVRNPGPTWASRGGEKLAAALDAFGIDVSGWCAWMPAHPLAGSRCPPERGARRVYQWTSGTGSSSRDFASDRGSRSWTARTFGIWVSAGSRGLATLDLSFISLRRCWPRSAACWRRGTGDRAGQAQFEAGRDDVPRGGVVRDRPSIAASSSSGGGSVRRALPRSTSWHRAASPGQPRVPALLEPPSHRNPIRATTEVGILVDARLESRITI